MQKEKIVTVNFGVARNKVVSKARKAVKAVGKKLAAAGEAVTQKAKEHKDDVVARVLDKGIELSEKQLKSLRNVRKKMV